MYNVINTEKQELVTGSVVNVKSFPDLVQWMIYKLNWPMIGRLGDGVDEHYDRVTYEYDDGSFIYDPNFIELRQLAPLETDQVMGVFFLTLKRMNTLLYSDIIDYLTRHSDPCRKKWNCKDLLFIVSCDDDLTFLYCKNHYKRGCIRTTRIQDIIYSTSDVESRIERLKWIECADEKTTRDQLKSVFKGRTPFEVQDIV